MFAIATANARTLARESRLNSITFPELGISCAYSHSPCSPNRMHCRVAVHAVAFSYSVSCQRGMCKASLQFESKTTMRWLYIGCGFPVFDASLLCAYTALTLCKKTNHHGCIWKCSCALLLPRVLRWLEIENIPKRDSSLLDHWHGPAGPRRKDRSEPESIPVIYWDADTD